MKSLTLIAVLILLFATSNCALIGLEEEEEETETAETGSIDDLQGTWAKSCTDSSTESAVFSSTNLTATFLVIMMKPALMPVLRSLYQSTI